jgi:hypothetical protein
MQTALWLVLPEHFTFSGTTARPAARAAPQSKEPPNGPPD